MKLAGLSLILVAATLATADGPAFEAASVKPASPETREWLRGGPGTSDPGQVFYSGASLSRLILVAYGAKAYQLSGPAWMGTGKFDIVAKVPDGSSKQQVRLMLQNLLAERFDLKLHHESQDLMGYELQIGKDGHKLKPAGETFSQDDKARESVLLLGGIDIMPPRKMEGTLIFWDRSLGRGTLKVSNGLFRSVGVSQTMENLVTLCEAQARLPIVVKTGLTGKFDYSFDYAPDRPTNQEQTAPAGAAMDPGPDFLTAFQRQLGFKLEKKKVPIDVLIIDSADRVPVEN
jgi:uncharacterized protein (TIGR03435 family)